MSKKKDDIPQAIKWHGGKAYLAKRIVALMPKHVHYVEPFFGGGAVLWAKNPEGVSEVVNDLNGDLTNFWSVLARPDAFADFQRRIEATPCSETAFKFAQANLGTSACPAERAANFFIVNRQSRQALGKDFATLAKTRTRRGMNELPSAWLTSVEGLLEVHNRFKRVVILNRCALKVIRTQDGPKTLFYCDPTYLPETRSTVGEYEHEMSFEDHVDLLTLLATIQGKFLLSGYRSKLYDDWADEHGMNRVDFDLPNNASSAKTKERKTECVWMNFNTTEGKP